MKLSRLPAVLVTAALFALLPACSSVEQAAFDNWLSSPAVQTEIGDMTQFAFVVLNGYLASQTSVTATPNFSGCEAAVIAAVQKQFNLNTREATYVVKQAEARIVAKAALKGVRK